MPLKDKNFYNEMSAEKLGWEPEWFNCDDFDDKLVEAIKKFQKEHDLGVDGLCGENTFRKVYTHRKASEEFFLKQLRDNRQEESRKFIYCNGHRVIINWDKVVTLGDSDNLELKSGYKAVEDKRTPTQFIVHWDATLSSKHCYDILKRRGLSVQFSIDNSGVIYQFVDTKNVCWHAKPNNFISVGVEISNAFYPKYQKYYEKMGHGERPVLKNVSVHGRKIKEMLGFYPVQVEALEKLIEAVCGYHRIPLETPNKEAFLPESKRKTFKGVLHHYHINPGKIDCAGLDLQPLLNNIKERE